MKDGKLSNEERLGFNLNFFQSNLWQPIIIKIIMTIVEILVIKKTQNKYK